MFRTKNLRRNTLCYCALFGLLSVPGPAGAAQPPAAPAATQSSQTSGYAHTYSDCQDVAGQIPVPAVGGGVRYDGGELFASRGFAPFHEDLYARWGKTVGATLSSDWVAKANLKVVLLEGPKHGKLDVRKSDHPLAEAGNPFWDSYNYIPERDFLGKDRVAGSLDEAHAESGTSSARRNSRIPFHSIRATRDAIAWNGEGDALDFAALCSAYVLVMPGARG